MDAATDTTPPNTPIEPPAPATAADDSATPTVTLTVTTTIGETLGPVEILEPVGEPGPEDKRHPTTRCLSVSLTQHEQDLLRRELLDVLDDEEALADEKRESNAGFKERAESLANRRKSLARKMRRGAEDRDVECEIQESFATNTIRVVRLDTLEVIEERAMTPTERQVSMQFDAPPPVTGEPLLPGDWDQGEDEGDEEPDGAPDERPVPDEEKTSEELAAERAEAAGKATSKKRGANSGNGAAKTGKLNGKSRKNGKKG